MVLTSIIIGLGITNVLLGVSGAIERYSEGERTLVVRRAGNRCARILRALIARVDAPPQA